MYLREFKATWTLVTVYLLILGWTSVSLAAFAVTTTVLQPNLTGTNLAILRNRMRIPIPTLEYLSCALTRATPVSGACTIGPTRLHDTLRGMRSNGFYFVRSMPMKSTSIFLSSRFFTTSSFFRFLSIHQIVIHGTSPPLGTEGGVSPMLVC